MNGQKIANILTVLFLLGGLALVGFFMVLKWDVFTRPVGSGGTTITAGIVAFVVTFLVLILITFAIIVLKWIMSKGHKNVSPKIIPTVSSETKKNTQKTIQEDSELIAVLTAAIHASNRIIAPYDTFKIFKVKEMITSSSSWRIFSKDDLSGVGG